MTDYAALGAAIAQLVQDAVRDALSESVGSAPTGDGAPPPYALAYTPAEAAQVLRIGLTKMRTMLKSGEIPSFRDGGIVRIRRSALEEWMRAKEQGGSSWQETRAMPVVQEVFGHVAPIKPARSSGGQAGRNTPRRSR